MESEEKAGQRKRGAQPGNANALKHGFYSRWFRPIEQENLEMSIFPGVMDEIGMLRVMMGRFFEMVTSETPDLPEMSKALTTLGLGACRLGGLIRLQLSLESQNDDVAQALSAALNDAVKELSK